MYKADGEGGEEPDWVASEREQFNKFRDRFVGGLSALNFCFLSVIFVDMLGTPRI